MNRSKWPAYELVLLATPTDIKKCIEHLEYYKESLKPDKISLIASHKVKEMIPNNQEVYFIDENDIIPDMTLSAIKDIFLSEKIDVDKAGWYFQQFLKLSYCYKTEYDYYLVWDSDTIPIHEIRLFDEEKPVFGMKKEYHELYFETIQKLFGFGKSIHASFISEHMMFEKELVKEMIQEIENNSQLEGTCFWEKILFSACPRNKLERNCFSEFETYGTWIMNRYPNRYKMLEYKSYRQGKSLTGYPPNKARFAELQGMFDAISYEAWDMGIPLLDYMRKVDKHEHIPMKIYYILCEVKWQYFFFLQRREWRKRDNS